MQEIGPRFTLKLRWIKKGLPAVKNLGEAPKTLEFDTFDMPEADEKGETDALPQAGLPVADNEDVPAATESPSKPAQPPQQDEYQWMWKVCLCLVVSRTYD